jgi:glycogen operon protein
MAVNSGNWWAPQPRRAPIATRSLVNYWRYKHGRFLCARGSKRGAGEFKTTVKASHDEGIEVILDVAYNHTAEGNGRGPTLSFRGIDNASYYRLDANHRRHYVASRAVATHSTLAIDSLRY